MKLLLVDGSNLLFQMFFGMPARITNAEGKAIQGTLGFVGALLKIIRMTDPTHIAVLFDGETHNPRKELDEAYKANREDYSTVEESENPFSQLPDIYAALDYLHICHAETTDCETDDWIAGYAAAYADREIIISSFDSDFFQLITDNHRILRYRGDHTVFCDRAYLKEKFGILPEQYAEFKALTGDTADNIRGVDKVGPKTAAELLNRFGSLEALLTRADEITKPSVRASVKEHTERARKNYRLIRLDGTKQLPFVWEELSFTRSDITTTEVLKAIGLK